MVGKHPIENWPHIVPFIRSSGIKITDTEMQVCFEDFYLLLVTDEMFEMIANQTNMPYKHDQRKFLIV